MPRLQELIHALELGAGARYLRLTALFLAVVTMAVIYNVREFQNLRSEEAMDAAQLGRNIAEGRGFTTRYVRPVSMALIQKHDPNRDPQIKGEHPDIVNAPLYPLLLAGVMKIPGLFQHEIASPKEGEFMRHQPDLLITILNQLLFFAAILLTWRLARRLFEPKVAWIAVLLMLGSDLLWQFSSSGLSTMLGVLLMTILANILQALHAGSLPESPRSPVVLLLLAAAAGLTCALLALTRYSLAIIAIPTLVFLAGSFPGRRAVLPAVAGVAFLVGFTPWLVRNTQVCGNPFGLAAYSIVQETPHHTETWFYRGTETDVSKVDRDDLVRKAFAGAAQLLRQDLGELGGSWIGAFFLVGLLVRIVQPTRSSLRWWTVGTLVALCIAQVLSRTHLSTDTPRINSENLLVLLAPLVLIFGAALILVLVATLDLAMDAWRNLLIGLIIAVLWLPLLVAFGPPRTDPRAYPPYYPPTIQRVAEWFEPGELIMSDMPWAVAWYGNRQSILLTTTPDRDFMQVNDWQKTINGLYLTRITLDQRFTRDWVLNGVRWGRFVIQFLTQQTVPDGFPLRQAPLFLTTFPDHLLFADRRRWQDTAPITPPKNLERPDRKKEEDAEEKAATPSKE